MDEPKKPSKKYEGDRPSKKIGDERPSKKLEDPAKKKTAPIAAPAEDPAKARLHECPRCHLSLQPEKYEGVAVDYCRDHGLWLDTGEIKRAQILDERTGAVRKALRSSFDRAAVEADEDS